MSLLGLALTCSSCGDSTSTTELISVAIESQDKIVSEDGELQLTRGTLAIRSVSLIGITQDFPENVPIVGPVTVDLSIRAQELPLLSSIPAGSYTGLRIELAPDAAGGDTLNLDLEAVTTEESVRAISGLTMGGNADFPEGPRTITESSEVVLLLSLRGMFFYLAPVSDAVDGVYVAGESSRDFLTMDLVGIFDFRVLP